MINHSYDEYKQLIEDYLLDFLPRIDEKSESLYDSMVYSLEAGGKRLRPVLVLAAFEFFEDNLDLKTALPFALAMEYIHTYSLIHDDLPAMDDDDFRRGLPTNHIKFGEAMAILAGDGLLNSACEAMSKNLLVDLDDFNLTKRKIKAMDAIVSAAGCRGMIAGQVADIEAEGKKSSEEMLQYINMNKTGAMINGAVAAGCHLGNANSKQFRDFTEFAQYLGLAFQIKDDILDIEGDEQLIGKNKGSDIENEKSTYPNIYGLEKSKEKLKEATDKAKACLKEYGAQADFFIKLAEKLEYRES